jgi:hypothetical protein
MTTLISYQSSGGDQGRCDAKCYVGIFSAAQHHGAGKQQAIDNTRELAQCWIEQARANGQDFSHVELAVDAMHQPLFDLVTTGGGK